MRRSLLLALVPVAALAYGWQAEKPAAENVATPAGQEQPAPPKQEPLSPERRADVFMARKMYREAIDVYRTVPETAQISNKIGIAYHQMQDFNSARKYYERAIKENPKYPEAVNNLGTIFYARKNYGRAVRQYRKALKLIPDSASIYSNLGTAYFARKDYNEALEAYQQALKLDPDVFEHRSSYGVLLQERTVDERAKFHYYLAKLYAQSGNTERALQYIRKALEEGFKEKNKFLEDPEFAALKDNEDFKQLMAQGPRVL